MKPITAAVNRNTGGFYTAAIVLLLIRVCSYFMLSDDVATTQALKIIMRLFVTVVSGVMLLRISNAGPQNKITGHLPLVFYCFYLLLGIASLSWTSSFADSALHLMMDIETLCFAYLYVKMLVEARQWSNGTVRVSKVIAITVFILACAFIMGRYLNPEMFFRLTHGGEEARLGGYIINPNELGMLLVIGISTASIELKHSYNKWVKWIMMALMVYALMLTGSRSSMIALMLVALFFVFQSKTVRMKLFILFAIAAAAPLITHEVFIKQGNIEEVLSMTGRIPFWQDLISINFQREPLLGYGYMRIDYTDKFESINSYAGAMTHNTFLQVLMGLGLTGLFIVLMQLSATIHSMIKCNDEKLKRLSMALFIPVLINSFTEFGIFGETNYGIMFYLFIIFSVTLKPESTLSRMKMNHAKRPGTLFRSAATA